MQNDSLFKQDKQNNQAGHLNGFSFTNDGQKIFMSFKNLSDVYLYDIAKRKFINSLKRSVGHSLAKFQQQHGLFLTNQTELLIYNNNIIEREEQDGGAVTHPSMMVFKYDTITQTCYLVW